MKFNDKILGEVASTKEITNEINNDKDIKKIDVMWCDKNDKFPVLCFEVENTTDFHKALARRFNKLSRYQTKFFFVAPNEKSEEFEIACRALPRGITKERCRFISYPDLEAICNSISFCEKITQVLGEKLTLEI